MNERMTRLLTVTAIVVSLAISALAFQRVSALERELEAVRAAIVAAEANRAMPLRGPPPALDTTVE